MFCRKCGTQNPDNTYRCVQCGEVLQAQAAVPPPAQQIPNYLVQSILVTAFCCLPLGIPAIVFSAQVNGRVQAGDIAGAMALSKRAKYWGWWAFGVGFAFGGLWLLMVFVGAAFQ